MKGSSCHFLQGLSPLQKKLRVLLNSRQTINREKAATSPRLKGSAFNGLFLGGGSELKFIVKSSISSLT